MTFLKSKTPPHPTVFCPRYINLPNIFSSVYSMDPENSLLLDRALSQLPCVYKPLPVP